MLLILNILSSLALVGTAAAPVLFFFDHLGESALRGTLLACTVLWFAASVARQNLAKTE